VTWYLELPQAAAYRPARARPGFEVRRAEHPAPELSRFFYGAVGGDWYWTDRLAWTREAWQAWLDRAEVETWLGHLDGTPAGYFELEFQPERQVEIVYFGLLPGFAGRGLGGALLGGAIERALGAGATRVWCHTCSLDHPAALNNYRARGMRVYRQEVSRRRLPERSPGTWPGIRGTREQAAAGR
jgi:ribosomal protein S18 acetylase RimI-like enzyme